MKKALLIALGSMTIGCGSGGDSESPVAPPVATLDTRTHTEPNGIWDTDGVRLSGVTWRRLDLGFHGALRVSFNFTLTNNSDPSRTLEAAYSLKFYDRSTGLQLSDDEWAFVGLVTLGPGEDRKISGVHNLPDITTILLANQISKMQVSATFREM